MARRGENNCGTHYLYSMNRQGGGKIIVDPSRFRIFLFHLLRRLKSVSLVPQFLLPRSRRKNQKSSLWIWATTVTFDQLQIQPRTKPEDGVVFRYLVQIVSDEEFFAAFCELGSPLVTRAERFYRQLAIQSGRSYVPSFSSVTRPPVWTDGHEALSAENIRSFVHLQAHVAICQREKNRRGNN